MRTCSKCQVEKELTEFHKDKTHEDGLSYFCKACKKLVDKIRRSTPEYKEKAASRMLKYRKDHPELDEKLKTWFKTKEGRTQQRKVNLKRFFGITPEQYDEMLKNQNYKCKICGTDKPEGQGNFHVDHDHKTNEIRGLLCHKCNTGIGLLKEDTVILNSAIEYLSSTKQYYEDNCFW